LCDGDEDERLAEETIAVMACSRCGGENPDHVKFCSRCGAELPRALRIMNPPPPASWPAPRASRVAKGAIVTTTADDGPLEPDAFRFTESVDERGDMVTLTWIDAALELTRVDVKPELDERFYFAPSVDEWRRVWTVFAQARVSSWEAEYASDRYGAGRFTLEVTRGHTRIATKGRDAFPPNFADVEGVLDMLTVGVLTGRAGDVKGRAANGRFTSEHGRAGLWQLERALVGARLFEATNLRPPHARAVVELARASPQASLRERLGRPLDLDDRARAALVLRHPGIVPVIDVGARGDALYYASAYAWDLPMLGSLMKTQPAFVRALHREHDSLASIASALDAVHAAGLVHGNVSTDSIRVAGSTFVLDALSPDAPKHHASADRDALARIAASLADA
jgi:hypothetical protein